MAALAAITTAGCTSVPPSDDPKEPIDEVQLRALPNALDQPPQLTLNGVPVAPYLVDWASSGKSIRSDATGNALASHRVSGDVTMVLGPSVEPASIEVFAYSGQSSDIDPMSDPAVRWDCAKAEQSGCTMSMVGETLHISLTPGSLPAQQSVLGVNVEYFASPEQNESRFANIVSWVVDIENQA